jgi:CBS domain-containing protein
MPDSTIGRAWRGVMTIQTILESRSGDVVQATPDAPVRAVIRLLADHRIGAVPIVQDDRVVGIMSERDVIYCLAGKGPATLDWPVERVMTSPAISIDSSVSPLAALSLMTRRRIRHLPVVESERMIGFVSIGDLVKARIDMIEGEAAAMRAYIAG